MLKQLKIFYTNYKYDIYAIMLWALYFYVLCDIGIKPYGLVYWGLGAFTLIFRFLGYKEGIYKVSNDLIKYNNDIVVKINTNKFTEHIVEIKDLKKGMFFSLVNDESQDKYIKCGYVTDGYATCWNLTSESFALMKDTQECILYQTKIIYRPVVKAKENN